MKQKRILNFFTSSAILLMLCFCASSFAQNDSISISETDSIKTKEKYGIRVGTDVSKLIRSFLDDDYKGFEINGDYRLTRKWYIAGEIGTEEKTTSSEFLNATAKGSYFKAGTDYNAYQNWFGMENMIYGGLRVGASTFSQTLNSFEVYSQNQYWQPQFSSSESQEFKGLTAIWSELILGLKVEILNNLYLGANFQIKAMISQDQPDNFENLYVPGFNKTYDGSRFSIGYGYNISYLIPLYKKDK